MFLLLCSLLIVSLFSPFIFGNYYYVYQQLGNDSLTIHWPIAAANTELISSGQIGLDAWGWNYGAGASVASVAQSMMDPFVWLLTLIQGNNILDGTLVIAILKMILAGLLFYKCLEWRGFAWKTCILLGLVFAVNSYAVLWSCLDSNMTSYVFMVGILFGYEYYRKTGNGLLITAFVFLLAMQFPYYLYMILIMVAAIAIVDCVFSKSFKQAIFYLLKGGSYIIFGIGLAAFAFLPQCYSLLSNPRADGQLLPSFAPASIKEYAAIFLRMFNAWGGFGAYTPVSFFSGPLFSASIIAVVALPQLFVKKLRTKKIICITCILFAALLFINITTPIFNGFSQNTYRWSWMLLIPILYGAAKVFSSFERTHKFNRKIAIITAITVLILWFFAVLYAQYSVKREFGVDLRILDISLFANGMALVIFAAIFLALLFSGHSTKLFSRILVFTIIAAECFVMPAQLLWNREPLEKQTGLQKTYFDETTTALAEIKANDGDWYRIDKDYSSVFLDDAMVQGYEGIKAYFSTNNPYYFEFSQVMEAKPAVNFIYGFDDRPVMQSLLGVKYLISREKKDIAGFDLLYDLGNVFVYENNIVLPIGFMYYDFYDKESFLQLGKEEKEAVLTQYAVLDDVDSPGAAGEGRMKGTLAALTDRQGAPFVMEGRTKDSISGKVDAKQDGLIFFSIPYDRGWTTFVDEIETEVVTANIGFCGVPVPAGEHDIRMEFTPVGYESGIIISCVFIAGGAVGFVIWQINKRRISKRPTIGMAGGRDHLRNC